MQKNNEPLYSWTKAIDKNHKSFTFVLSLSHFVTRVGPAHDMWHNNDDLESVVFLLSLRVQVNITRLSINKINTFTGNYLSGPYTWHLDTNVPGSSSSGIAYCPTRKTRADENNLSELFFSIRFEAFVPKNPYKCAFFFLSDSSSY